MLCGIPAARGRSTQKRDAEAGTAKGRGLPFRGGHGPKAIRGQGGSELFDPVSCPTGPRLTPSFGGCVAWMQGMYDNTNHSVQSHGASCVVQSLPTAAPSILRRLFAKLRLAQDSAASRSTEPVSVPTAPPRSALTESVPLSTVPPGSGPPAEPKSVYTTAHPSVPSEADN